MKSFNVAIFGATGYSGIELVKSLLEHPFFKISYLFSNSSFGEKISSLYPFLDGIFDCKLDKIDFDIIAKDCNLAFLALPHKQSMRYVKELLKLGIKVIDLSADYRLRANTYEKCYSKHEDKANISKAVYGIPEIFECKIKKAVLIANPGCYPIASILPIVPLLDYIDNSKSIFIDAKSGVSGAGKKLSSSSHFVSINENCFSYNPMTHRHSYEIKEKLESFCKDNLDLVFVPHLLPITRGMLVSIYCNLKKEIDPIAILNRFYLKNNFVRIKNKPVDIKSTQGTSYCDIFAKTNKKQLFISSSIDNLLRGASGTAIMNANLMFNLDIGVGINKIAYIP